MRKRYVLPAPVVCLLGSLFLGGCHSTPKAVSEQPRLAATAPASALPPSSWIVPVDVTPSTNPPQSSWTTLAWQEFVALNWPSAVPADSSGVSGLPNSQLSIGASSSNGAMIPTVWLTYRSVANTMLPGAQDPGPWQSNPVAFPAGCQAMAPPYQVSTGYQPMLLDLISKFSSPVVGSDVDEASGPPLIEQSGWFVTFDIRVDQSEYAYIQQNGYYNAQTQTSAETANGQLLPFPRTGAGMPSLANFGALEVKAAWRILNPATDQAIIPRYYTQAGYFLQQDGKTCQGPALFGLIGLHILRLTPTTPSTWFWATFEQVDNVVPPSQGVSATLAAANTPNGNCPPPTATIVSPYNVPPSTTQYPPNKNIPWTGTAAPVVNVCQVTNVGSAVQSANQTWQNNLQGTVWANYQLIDTINPSVQGGPTYPIAITNTNVNTNILANTTMETYLQGNGPGNGQSCMDCHAFATPQGAPKTNPSANQIFTFVLSNAGMPLSAAAKAKKRQPLPKKVLAILSGMNKRH
jgi:hypothetical protein